MSEVDGARRDTFQRFGGFDVMADRCAQAETQARMDRNGLMQVLGKTRINEEEEAVK